MSLKQVINKMPPWAVGTVAVITIAGVGFATYKIVVAVNNYKAQKGSRTEDRAVDSDLRELTRSGQGPTLSRSQSAALANQIFTAMDGYGTDNKQILAAFSNVKNEADVLAIIDDFGTKEVSSGAFNPEPNYKGRLPGAIVSEMPREGHSYLNWGLLLVNPAAGIAALSNGDIGVNTLNKMFEEKNINFKF